MKSIKVREYSRSRSFHYDLILQDQASGERSQDQWSSGFMNCSENISKAILPVLLIQDEHYCQLVVKGMCTRDWYPASGWLAQEQCG